VSVAVFDHERSKHEIILMNSGEHLETPGDTGSTLDRKPEPQAP
jgi:hypothetical protein